MFAFLRSTLLLEVELYTDVPGNEPDFGGTFLGLQYFNIVKNTYIRI
jgi:hypothetical protein